MEKDGSFILFASYPICHWSGTLGPKLREGDKQTPEGFYTLSSHQLRHIGRWPRSLNLGFPNAYDRVHGRNGSYILVHGGCSSVGCIAMTNPVISEVHALARAALKSEQRHIPVHVFPFRMTADRLASQAQNRWSGFWSDLEAGYQSFERTRRPPRITVCDGRYMVEDGLVAQAGAETPQGSARDNARRRAADGAIRVACPARDMAAAERTAESKHALSSATMSRLGGPLPRRSPAPN
jgi:murein L,D-transpeptidase YafK